MSKDQYDHEQDDIVTKLVTEVETLTEEETEDLFGQLDEPHREEANEQIQQWANDAVGSDDWDRR